MEFILALKSLTLVEWGLGVSLILNVRLMYKFSQLDKLALVHSWILHLKLGVKTVKQHRNNDYEIINPIDFIKE